VKRRRAIPPNAISPIDSNASVPGSGVLVLVSIPTLVFTVCDTSPFEHAVVVEAPLLQLYASMKEPPAAPLSSIEIVPEIPVGTANTSSNKLVGAAKPFFVSIVERLPNDIEPPLVRPRS
jgi:hypothetical protein